jgi:uncharacterized protein involved in outer membrane biogenesis
VRVLGWAALLLAPLLAGALVAADRLATAYVQRPETRARIEAGIRDALAREFTYAELSVSLLPPSLVATQIRVAGGTPDAPPLLTAEQVSLRVALAPLLARVVVLDSLVVDGAQLRLVRARRGLLLPELGREVDRAQADAESVAGEGGFSLKLRGLELRDAVVELEDRLFAPPLRTRLEHVAVRAERPALASSFALEIDVVAEGGGRLSGRGSASLDGELDLEVALDGFPLAPLAPYSGRADELAGRVFGSVSVRGPAAAPDPLTAQLELRDARLSAAGFSAQGRLGLHATYRGRGEPQQADFALDASDAALSFRDVFDKPPGRLATLTGRAVLLPEGRLAVEDVVLRVLGGEARGRIETGPRLRVSLRVPRTELDAWQPLLRALAGTRLSGAVEVVGVEVATHPLELRGEVRALDVSVETPQGAFDVAGTLVAEGQTLRSRGATLEAGGQSLPVQIEVGDLDGSVRYRMQVRAAQADTHELLAALSANDDSLYGPLDLAGDFAGDLAGETSAVNSLRGSARIDIVPGRLTGSNILRATLRQLDVVGLGRLIGALPRPGGKLHLAKGLEGYYTDRFESLGATLEVRGGVVRTPDFRLVTAYYDFDLDGAIELRDLSLDAKGQLVLGRELTGAIAGHIGLAKLPIFDEVVIPLPHIGGTLTDPRPEPDFGMLVRLLTGNLPGVRQIDRFLRDLKGLGRH